MPKYFNVGVMPLDDLNKTARKLLKKTNAGAVLILIVRDGVEIAAAGRQQHISPAELAANLRTAADRLEREAASRTQ